MFKSKATLLVIVGALILLGCQMITILTLQHQIQEIETRKSIEIFEATAKGAMLPSSENKHSMPVVPLSDNLKMYTLPVPKISEDFPAPCIVHRTAQSYEKALSQTKKKHARYYGSWSQLMPPYCLQVLWTDAAIQDLVELSMPEAMTELSWLKTGTERGDFARMLAMYYYGGVYADNDVELKQPLENWTLNNTDVGLIVGLEFNLNVSRRKRDQIVQYVFAAVPRHPVIGNTLTTMLNNIREERTTGNVYYRNYGINAKVLARTGPIMLTRVLDEYLANFHVTIRDIAKMKRAYKVPGSDVLVLPVESFNPKRAGNPLEVPGLTMIKHYFEGRWAQRKRGSWAVRNPKTPAKPTQSSQASSSTPTNQK